MASYRKRGAHAARPATRPFVAVKRVHQPTAPPGGLHTGTGGNAGGGRPEMRGGAAFAPANSLPKVIAAMLVIGLGRVASPAVCGLRPSAEPTAAGVPAGLAAESYRAAAELTTGRPRWWDSSAGRLPSSSTRRHSSARWARSASTGTRHTTASAIGDLGQDRPPLDTAAARSAPDRIRMKVCGPSVITPACGPGLRLRWVQQPARARSEDASGVSAVAVDRSKCRGRPDRLHPPGGHRGQAGRITKLDPISCCGFIPGRRRDSSSRSGGVRRPRYSRMAAAVQGPADHKPEKLQAVQQHRPGMVRVGGHETSAPCAIRASPYGPGATVAVRAAAARQRDLAGDTHIKVVTETARGHQVRSCAAGPGRPRSR